MSEQRWYCRGCKKFVPEREVSRYAGYFTERHRVGCNFRCYPEGHPLADSVSDDLNVRWVSPVGRELAQTRIENERLLLEVVQLRQQLVSSGVEVKPFCGAPTHGDFLLDKPGEFSGC